MRERRNDECVRAVTMRPIGRQHYSLAANLRLEGELSTNEGTSKRGPPHSGLTYEWSRPSSAWFYLCEEAEPCAAPLAAPRTPTEPGTPRAPAEPATPTEPGAPMDGAMRVPAAAAAGVAEGAGAVASAGK